MFFFYYNIIFVVNKKLENTGDTVTSNGNYISDRQTLNNIGSISFLARAIIHTAFNNLTYRFGNVG